MKVELEAREEGKTGNKAWLRRRLHAAIVREHHVAVWRRRATSDEDRGVMSCDAFTAHSC
eukprot:6742625-Prymnesium_polylepis.1